ncbi:hypothetical protein AgCh_024818 [Apium graveolens]
MEDSGRSGDVRNSDKGLFLSEKSEIVVDSRSEMTTGVNGSVILKFDKVQDGPEVLMGVVYSEVSNDGSGFKRRREEGRTRVMESVKETKFVFSRQVTGVEDGFKIARLDKPEFSLGVSEKEQN